MVQFRACSRCGGDLQANRDMYGEYVQCLQCGYMLDIQKKSKARGNWSEAGSKRRSKEEAA